MIRRNLSVRSDIGRSGEIESHVVINIPEEIAPKVNSDLYTVGITSYLLAADWCTELYKLGS